MWMQVADWGNVFRSAYRVHASECMCVCVFWCGVAPHMHTI